MKPRSLILVGTYPTRSQARTKAKHVKGSVKKVMGFGAPLFYVWAKA